MINKKAKMNSREFYIRGSFADIMSSEGLSEKKSKKTHAASSFLAPLKSVVNYPD